MMKLWSRAFIESIVKAAEPFFSLSIWADAVTEMYPNDQGVSKTKSGDWPALDAICFNGSLIASKIIFTPNS